MKKFILSIICVISLIISTGCQQKDITREDKHEEQKTLDSEVINTIDDQQYYLVTNVSGLYSYSIFNKNYEVIRFEEGLSRQPTITMIYDNILSITIQAGTGIATSSTYYYDIDNNQFSPIYQTVLTQSQNIIVRATYNKIILQDIFDSNGYYQEISNFQETFAPVAFPFVKAEFIDDLSGVSITYLSGTEYKEVTESFVLVGQADGAC